MKLIDINRIPNQQYAIITSYRHGNTPSQNAARLSQLKSTLAKRGIYGVKIIGKWKGVFEPAVLVYSIDLKSALNIGLQYNQDAIIYKGPETGGEIYLIYRNGQWKKFKSAFEDFQSMS